VSTEENPREVKSYELQAPATTAQVFALIKTIFRDGGKKNSWFLLLFSFQLLVSLSLNLTRVVLENEVRRLQPHFQHKRATQATQKWGQV
jgi:hypothetical protein